MPGILHAQNRGDFDRKSADAGKAILHLALLVKKGFLIAHVLCGAAPAAAVNGARRLCARGRGREDFFHAPKGIAAFDLDDAHAYPFSVYCAGHKHRKPVGAADALGIHAIALHGQVEQLIFMKRRRH